MNESKCDEIKRMKPVRTAFWAVVLCAMLSAFGCGGDAHQGSTTDTYPSGISEDIEHQLKFDARVDSFEPSDANSEDLMINVNDSWLNSPPGMQERSVGQWYTIWHADHSGTVIVQHDGNKIATWSSDSGYQPVNKPKAGEADSGS